MYRAIFDDFQFILNHENARTLYRDAYSLLRCLARYNPETFVHLDFPELRVTVVRFTIPEDRSEDGNLHTTTCIERTVF